MEGTHHAICDTAACALPIFRVYIPRYTVSPLPGVASFFDFLG